VVLGELSNFTVSGKHVRVGACRSLQSAPIAYMCWILEGHFNS
jgi:hypothetical protein